MTEVQLGLFELLAELLATLLDQTSIFFSQNLIELSHYIIDPNKRIFGIYLLSAALLAIPVYLAALRKAQTAQTNSKNNQTTSNQPESNQLGDNQPRNNQLENSHPKNKGSGAIADFLAFLLPKRIYTHPSAKQDYALFVINKCVRALLIAPVVITMVPIALGTTDILESIFGQQQPITQSPTVIIVSFTIMLFIFDDLTRFLLHLALHKIPVLWEFHKVHHSAKVLTPFTIYRSHPLENFLYASRMAIAQGMSVGIGYFLFGPTLNMLDILGANIFVFIFNLFGSNLRHSHIWLSWGNRVENWFISPAQHQIHHSDNPTHFDRNLGSALAIWDKLAGTLIKASDVESISLGAGKQHTGHQTLLAIYFEPFRDAFMTIRPKRTKSATRPPNSPNPPNPPSPPS